MTQAIRRLAKTSQDANAGQEGWIWGRRIAFSLSENLT